MTARPILYSFRRCPYAMRARLALLVSETVCDLREVKLAHKPPEMIAVSPKATVPVLLLPDGHVIDQSLDIMRWALDQNDPEGWRERDDASLIEINDGAFKYHLDRYKYADRYNTDRVEHRASGLRILARLDARLESHANLCGNAHGLADAAIMPFIRQFAETDRGWFDAQPLPWLKAWLDRHLASPLFKAAMVRLHPWQQHDAPTLFPTDG